MCESWQRTIWQCLWNLFLVPSGDRWTSYARLQFEVRKIRLIGMRGGDQGVGALNAWLWCGAQAQTRITVLCSFARKFNFKVLLSTWAVDFFKHFIKKEKKTWHYSQEIHHIKDNVLLVTFHIILYKDTENLINNKLK